RPLVFYTAATITIAAFCFGPIIRAGGATLATGPYSWLLALPGFDEVRVVSRFWMVGVLCLSVAAGLRFDTLMPGVASRRRLGFVVAALCVLVDGWMPGMRMAQPPALWAIEPPDRPEPILELPIGGEADWAATFRAAGHHRRVVNGVSGYDPPHYIP